MTATAADPGNYDEPLAIVERKLGTSRHDAPILPPLSTPPSDWKEEGKGLMEYTEA